MVEKVIKYNVPYRASVLFVGINPHPGSDRHGIPFSNNRNFWYNLSRAGLIHNSVEELKDDRNLMRVYTEDFPGIYGYGFMNIVDRPTVNTTLLQKGEEVAGVRRIQQEIVEKKPLVVCFIGKVTYSKFSGENGFNLGFQESRIDDSAVYISSFPIRGLNSTRVAEMAELGRIVDRLREDRDNKDRVGHLG